VTAGETFGSASQALRIGTELRAELERAAREEGGIDGTALGRRIIREWLEARSAEAVPRPR
jgi:hypothetical protein